MSLPVRAFQAKSYRSLQSVSYPMSGLDLFVGPNGIGKTNLYRALGLIHAAATNRLVPDLSMEGGLESAIWAGPRRKPDPMRILLSVGFGDVDQKDFEQISYCYEVAIGYPPPDAAAFFNEPHIKTETLSYVTGGRRVKLLDRKRASVVARGEDGHARDIDIDLLDSETVLGRLEDPSRYPVLDTVRRTLAQWRFYHGFRVDDGSPLRQPCAAVATASLAADGSDLAAVFATLAHLRQDTTELRATVDRAFPGATLILPPPGQKASFGMRFADFPNRIFEAWELSDGTLRFLALAGALLAYRLPPFIALNEPEASLHPDMMETLSGLIVRAAERTQIWLVTHSDRLADAVMASGAGKVRKVFKKDGATQIEGLKAWGAFEDEEQN